MSLRIGIVGLPNVGKSTVFNALTQAQNAAVANYPFCTIKPNRAIIPVPDRRVDTLAELAGLGRTIHATIEFVDIAGLVKGASQGEGLGNQFLGHIRDADAILHVVRCFDDPNVVHVSANPDPRQDIEIINIELALADLEQLERKIDRLSRQVKGDKRAVPFMELALKLRDHLGANQPITNFPDQEDATFIELNQELRFLTGKPLIYAANVDEEGLASDNAYVLATRALAAEQEVDVLKLCAKLEEEMIGLSDQERSDYLALSGAEEGGLAQIIRKSYAALGLLSFFSMNEEEVRAWTVREGWTAPRAAGVIHTDFERGFIRAEVIPFDTFTQYGSSAAARAAGAMRIEGKEYVVQDGDIIYFRFNV